MVAATIGSDSITDKRRVGDRRLLIRGGWEQFQLIQQGLAQQPHTQLTYFDGNIEIFMPGKIHECFGELIGTLLTLFFIRKGIPFFPLGSTTQTEEGVGSLEPDKSFSLVTQKDCPDLAIEVIVTSGGIQKLDLYQVLGVSEIWFWEDRTLQLYHLRENGYDRVFQSELEGLSEMDLGLFQKCLMLGETDPLAASQLWMKIMN
jgi:Uma2 family endonuclease